MKLFLCTLHPLGGDTPEMRFTRCKLENTFELTPIYVEGNFTKGVFNPEIKDTEEVNQRNKYLQQVPDGEWMWIIDSDEIPIGCVDALPEILEDLDNKSIIAGSIVELRGDWKLMFRPRIIKKQPGMRYIFKHYWICVNGQRIADMDHALIPALGFLHYNSRADIDIRKIPGKVEVLVNP